ncbi:MAG: hypothetical protein DWQ04_13285 [Chloroflexi bacterium]|nr:MAG: hypothetical protein DWQ04_13285 [Chloroflexota bacterium]
MKEKNQNRGRTIIALALIVILGFTAIGNISRMIFGPMVKTAVHEAERDFNREFSQQDWDEFEKEMESLGEELGTIGEELGEELGQVGEEIGEEIGEELSQEFEQFGAELEREFESIDVEIDSDIDVEVEVGR